MEELQVIETTSGRQFKPWASREDVQAIGQETVQAVGQAVQDPASITAIASEIASGKQAIAEAINAKGGSASDTESFAGLAQSIEDIPNILNWNLITWIPGFTPNEGSALPLITDGYLNSILEINDTEGLITGNITPNVMSQIFTSAKKIILNGINVSSFGWNLGNNLEYLEMNSQISFGSFNNPIFSNGKSLKTIILKNATSFSLGNGSGPSYVEHIEVGVLKLAYFLSDRYCEYLRFVKIGYNTNINLICSRWTATNVIAEGQTGIDELNSNIMNNIVPNLYYNGGKTITFGATLYNVLTSDTIAAIHARGWNVASA